MTTYLTSLEIVTVPNTWPCDRRAIAEAICSIKEAVPPDSIGPCFRQSLGNLAIAWGLEDVVDKRTRQRALQMAFVSGGAGHE